MVNPRKAYPIDPGLIPIYEPVGRDNLGHALETAVLIELSRRGCAVRYFRTPHWSRRLWDRPIVRILLAPAPHRL